MNIRGRRSVRGSDPLRLDADGNPATPQHRINSPRPRTFSRAAPLNAGAAHGRSATRTPRVKVGTPSTVSPPRTAGLNRSSANTSKSIGVSSGELSFFSPQPGVESGHAPVLSTVVPSPEGCSIQMPRHLIQPTIPAEVRVVPAIASADSGSSPNREFDDNPLDGPLAAPLIEPDPTNQEESVIAFRRARRRSSLPVASIIERGPNSTIELPHRVPTPLGSAIDAAVATNPRGGHIPQRGGSAAASPEGSPLEGQAFRLRPQWRRSRASLYEDDTTNEHHSSSPSSTEGAQVLPSPSTPNAAPTAVFARHMNWAAASPRSGSAPEGRVDDASTRLATLNAPRHPPTPRMLYAPSRKIEEASVIKKTPHAPESANGVPHQHRRLSAAQQYVNGPGTGVRRHLPRSEDEEEGEDSVPRVHSSNAKKDKNHSSHHHGKLPNIMKASSPSHTAAVAPAPDPVEPTPKARPRRAVGASVNREYETVIKEVDRAVGDIAIAHAQLRQTAEEIASLLHSWELLTPRRSEFGQELYQVLLQSHVTYRNMFAKTDVRRQSESFMKMLDRGVVSFSHPAMLITLMQEVGARHRLYRVDVVHFLAMRDVFLRLFPKYVPVEVFQRALPMWECFWEMVIDLTVQGASSTRGAYFNSMHHEIWAEHVQRLFARLVDLQRGSPEDDDCEHLFFLELARKAANQHIGNHEVELFHSTRSCDRLMDALIHIVQALKSREDATRTLTEYRSKGVFIGFYSHIGSALRQSFVETCEDYLHRDLLWGAVAARSMGELWDYIFETLAELDEKDKASKSISGAGGMGPEHSDPFCLLYADVEGSTRLWDANPRVMKVAIENYQRAVRGVIEKYSGYEVKTVGDSFLIATRDPLSALKIALAIQFQFMRGPIAEGFKMLESTQGSGDHKSWRNDSLRIRIGIHYCTDSTAVRDPVHQRYDYYGPDVNCAARVEAAACGGQILMTKAALSVLESMPGYTCEECPMALEDWHNTEDDDEICGAPLKDFCTAQYVGDFPICGYMKVVKLFSVCHKSLAGRVFAAPRTPAAALTS